MSTSKSTLILFQLNPISVKTMEIVVPKPLLLPPVDREIHNVANASKRLMLRALLVHVVYVANMSHLKPNLKVPHPIVASVPSVKVLFLLQA